MSKKKKQSESKANKEETNNQEKGSTKDKTKKNIVNAIFAKERVICEDSDEARELYNKSCYGKSIAYVPIHICHLDRTITIRSLFKSTETN